MNLRLEGTASLSLDLDNKWTYLKTRGLPGWQEFPSYLDTVVPRVLQFLRDRSLRITFFIVGQDAALPQNVPLLGSIAAAGHEIGNHSFHHDPWLHLYSRSDIDRELDLAERHIAAATGRKPLGFRGPGFSVSRTVAEALAARGYLYDASSLPTFLGPLARSYYLLTARLGKDERRRRARLFGQWRDGLRPLKPHRCPAPCQALLEIPVSTTPVVRTPFHLSYLIWLSQHSQVLARQYLRLTLALCRATGVGPSFLLHPLDFIGLDEAPELAFFPGMQVPLQRKLELADFALASIAKSFRPLPLEEQAALAGAATSRTGFAPAAPPRSAISVQKGRCAYVMPVYQAQAEFEQTMQSLALSSTPCTVFIVDDGSQPPLQLQSYDPRLQVRLIRLPRNQGIVKALNAGLEAALAAGFEYIARIDAGDYASPDRLSRQIAYLEDHPHCRLVGSDSVVYDEDGSYCFTIEPPREPRLLNHALHQRSWLLHPGIMYRASVLLEVGLYTDAYKAAEDYEMFLRIAARHEVGVVPEPLLTYIQRKRSISGKNARVQAISRLRVQWRYFRWARWACYYGVFCTVSTLLMPPWAKHWFKVRFLYSQAAPARVDARPTISVNEGGS